MMIMDDDGCVVMEKSIWINMVYDAMLNYGPLWIIMVKGGVLDPMNINNVPLVSSLVCNFSSFTLKAPKGFETLFVYLYIYTRILYIYIFIYIFLFNYLFSFYLCIYFINRWTKEIVGSHGQSLKRTAKNAKPSAVFTFRCAKATIYR